MFHGKLLARSRALSQWTKKTTAPARNEEDKPELVMGTMPRKRSGHKEHKVMQDKSLVLEESPRNFFHFCCCTSVLKWCKTLYLIDTRLCPNFCRISTTNGCSIYPTFCICVLMIHWLGMMISGCSYKQLRCFDAKDISFIYV